MDFKDTGQYPFHLEHRLVHICWEFSFFNISERYVLSWIIEPSAYDSAEKKSIYTFSFYASLVGV